MGLRSDDDTGTPYWAHETFYYVMASRMADGRVILAKIVHKLRDCPALHKSTPSAIAGDVVERLQKCHCFHLQHAKSPDTAIVAGEEMVMDPHAPMGMRPANTPPWSPSNK